MDWTEVVAIASSYPGAQLTTSYRTPAFKVRGTLLVRLRSEDDSLVLLEVTEDEKRMLIAADPVLFHTTAHYDGYPAVLARLAPLTAPQLRPYLDRRYRRIAGRSLLAAWTTQGAPPEAP